VVTVFMLWLPILLAAAATWVLNALFWTVSPHHRNDWKGLPAEGGLAGALRGSGLAAGMYYFPREKSPQHAKDPAAQDLLRTEPAGYIVVEPRGATTRMGKAMALSLVLNLFVSFLVAYAASVALDRGANYLDVFRLTATVGFLAYSTERISDSIWFGYDWRSTWKSMLDAAVIALVTAGIYGWLWPR
jgi:hypothetical protein